MSMNMNMTHTGTHSISKSKLLLLEHLPDIKYRQSMQGVLFLVFSNGEAFFYPLNEQTKGTSPQTAKMLTTDSSSQSKKLARATATGNGGSFSCAESQPRKY
jgi:hypothetical protein